MVGKFQNFLWSCVLLWQELVRWVAMTFRHFLDTLNIYFPHLQIFLEAAEVKVSAFLAEVGPQHLNFQQKFSIKSKKFYFFRILKRSDCCMTTKVGALDSPDL